MENEAPLKVVATKPLTLSGKSYKRGEPVDTSNLTQAKITQLLNHRLIHPDPTDT